MCACYSHLIICFGDASKMIITRLIMKQCGVFAADIASFPLRIYVTERRAYLRACAVGSDV
jgi:hypothetical protein